MHRRSVADKNRDGIRINTCVRAEAQCVCDEQVVPCCRCVYVDAVLLLLLLLLLRVTEF